MASHGASARSWVWWDGKKNEWTGLDTPDFTKDKEPGYRPSPGAEGDAALGGDKPFILHPDGVGWIYVSSGLKDGPLPTHYEPLESMFKNPLYPRHGTDPAVLKRERPDNQYSAVNDKRFPFVLTTYRLTEHHTAGGMTRTLSHLAELQPELFCEISPALAKQQGLRHGDYATITAVRSIVEARVMVTDRIKPLQVAGREQKHSDAADSLWRFRGASGRIPARIDGTQQTAARSICLVLAALCGKAGKAPTLKLEARRNCSH